MTGTPRALTGRRTPVADGDGSRHDTLKRRQLEGLGDIIESATAQKAPSKILISEAGQHDDGYGRVDREQAIQYLIAGHIGHDYVQQDYVGPYSGRLNQRVSPVVGDGHVVAERGEMLVNDPSDAAVIVHDEHAPTDHWLCRRRFIL